MATPAFTLTLFIIGEEQLSKLFGFARSYFMVDTDQPVRYVGLSVSPATEQRTV